MIGFPETDGGRAAQSWCRRREAPLFAERGMVAAAHPLTVTTGLAVLQRGGNAVDAAVAAALTAAVVMPEVCGLGGDLFAVLHAPAKDGQAGQIVSVHGSGISPRGASIEDMRAASDDGGRTMPYQGPLSISVPGMIDAYFTLLERFGSKPFAEVAEQAIGYAESGYALLSNGAGAIAENAALFGRFPASAAVFLPGGKAPKAGALFRQRDLARTLRTISAEGRECFYRGALATRIVAALREAGGALSAEDFADHATELTAPLESSYRGYTVYQTGLPTQGLIMLEALNIVECAELGGTGVDSAAGIHLLAEAKKRAYADRLGYACDPAFGDTPLSTLLSKEWAAERYAKIDPNRATDDVPAGALQDGDTTYLSVVDSAGMMVSLIQSVSSAFGSGVVAGETGVVLNNRVGRGFSLEEGHVNIYAPGKKTMHTLNCYLIADQEGAPVLVGGTPGGDGQPQWNLQAITGMIDAGLDVQAAIELPRWTSWPGTDPMSLDNAFELRIEDRAGDEVIGALEERGHRVRRTGHWGGGGAEQIIARNPRTGVLAGGSDPRVEGLALGY